MGLDDHGLDPSGLSDREQDPPLKATVTLTLDFLDGGKTPALRVRTVVSPEDDINLDNPPGGPPPSSRQEKQRRAKDPSTIGQKEAEGSLTVDLTRKHFLGRASGN